jgi:hypothetical protein
MSVISQGFRISFEILQPTRIKPGGAGQMENGQQYSASVKFLGRNVEERMNKDVGLQEVEETIEFIIPCVSNDEAALVSESLRKLRDLKSPFYIFGGIPKKYQNSEFPFVKSTDNGTEFLKKVESITKIKAEVKTEVKA